MSYSLSIELDRLNGKIKTTRHGDYRFSLITRNDANEVVTIIQGFRLDKNFLRVMPPAATNGRSHFHIATLSRDFEAKAISTIKSLVEAETQEPRP